LVSFISLSSNLLIFSETVTPFRQIPHRLAVQYSIVHDVKQRQLQTVAGKAAP